MKHGSDYTYKRKGCRCEACKAANAEANRRWRANRRERGDKYVRKDRVPSIPPRTCTSCGIGTRAKGPAPLCKPCSMKARRSVWVSEATRLAIYERDGWRCGFCLDPVDPDAPHNSPGQPTLDHVIPRSLGGTDDEANLRLLHRYCNNVRSNRAALTVDDLVA